MPVLGDVVTGYHRLMEQNGFGDTAWADELQQRMRKRMLTDSGRLLSPVLRPCFVTRKQVEAMAKTSAQLSLIFNKLQNLVIAAPTLLNRVRMLPAEKSLLGIEPGYKAFTVAGSMDASFPEVTCSVSGIDACRPAGFAYSGALAELFLELPVVKEFVRNGQKISKLPNGQGLPQAITAAWREFGGRTKPLVAVVDWRHASGDGASEGQVLAELLVAQGINAKFVPPEKLRFTEGELRMGDWKIDVVVRRILARELLMHWELNHPLLEAYRQHSICMVNSFRAEIGQRRAFLELLTDDTVSAHFTVAERKLLKQTIRWTRVVGSRKVQYQGQDVDLLEWALQNRERLILLPDQSAPELRTYAGSEMTDIAWEWALKQALKTPYVVQECSVVPAEKFPFFQYGESKFRDVQVTLQAQLVGGELGDCLGLLQSRAAGGVTPLGIAPVLVVG